MVQRGAGGEMCCARSWPQRATTTSWTFASENTGFQLAGPGCRCRSKSWHSKRPQPWRRSRSTKCSPCLRAASKTRTQYQPRGGPTGHHVATWESSKSRLLEVAGAKSYRPLQICFSNCGRPHPLATRVRSIAPVPGRGGDASRRGAESRLDAVLQTWRQRRQRCWSGGGKQEHRPVCDSPRTPTGQLKPATVQIFRTLGVRFRPLVHQPHQNWPFRPHPTPSVSRSEPPRLARSVAVR